MRMKRKTTFRLAAAALAMTQLFTAAASAAFTNGFSWSYPVGEGLTYTRTEGKNTAGVQRANVLTYEPNTGVSPVMVYAGDTVYGSKATITNAVKYLQNQGKTVIGGTNADFFVMSSGVPIGLVIDKGTLVSSDAWQYAVGFKKDGTAVIGRPTMGIRITGASGSGGVNTNMIHIFSDVLGNEAWPIPTCKSTKKPLKKHISRIFFVSLPKNSVRKSHF